MSSFITVTQKDGETIVLNQSIIQAGRVLVENDVCYPVVVTENDTYYVGYPNANTGKPIGYETWDDAFMDVIDNLTMFENWEETQRVQRINIASRLLQGLLSNSSIHVDDVKYAVRLAEELIVKTN